MKQILILLLMFLFSCNQTNQQGRLLNDTEGTRSKKIESDSEEKILTNVETYSPNNLVTDSNFRITTEMENQINLYKYIHTTYESDFRDFYSKILYTSKMFYSGQNGLLIDEIYANSDGSQERTSFEYLFNNQGGLKRVSRLDDENYSMEFSYNLDNQLNRAVNYKLFTPWTKTSGNDVTTYSPVRVTEEQILNYENGLLKSDNYSSHSPTVNLKDKGVYQYYKDYTDPNIKYIKYIRELDFRYSSEYLYCFNGDNLKFVTYKEGTIANPTPLLLRNVYLLSQYGNKIKILEYKLNFDTNKQEMECTYNIEMGSSIKINKIEETRSWRATEDYYQYRFQDNIMIGYEIFRADLDLKKDIDIQKREYKLTKAFLINQ